MTRTPPLADATELRQPEARRLTFAQARLLIRLLETPGASLFIEEHGRADYYSGPSFRGFFYYPGCATCGHANRESVSWRVIHALSEAECIKSTWGDIYDRVTDLGVSAADAARCRWPRMVIPGRQPGARR